MAGSLDGGRKGRVDAVSESRVPHLALRAGTADLGPQCSAYLSEYLDKMGLACADFDDDQIWARASAHANSIGNLLLHLGGNLSLWIGVTLGDRDFVRDRPAEFAADRTDSGEELFARLEEVVADCQTIIAGLDADALSRQHIVQGYAVSGLGALLHAVEHMGYHTGQVVLLAKGIRDRRGERLEFYPQLTPGGKP